MSLRKIGVLLRALPGDSMLGRAVHGEAGSWTLTNYQLADVIDAAALTYWAVIAAHAKRPPRTPPRYPRPAQVAAGGDPDDDDTERLSTSEEIRAFFGPASITYVGE